MDKQIGKDNQYTYDGRRQTRAIKANTQKRTINIVTMDEDILGQSIYLQWTNRQTTAINIPTMDEQTDNGNQYSYDGRTNGTGLSIYL